ncbi:MAG: RNA polymerase sigma factor [Rikenellaceae bacterium]
MSTVDDSTLVQRTLDGDRSAYGELVSRHREMVYRLLTTRIGSNTDIDDLMQESFIKAYINLHRFDPRYSFGQWLYTIARNTAVDHFRRRSDDLTIDDYTMPPSDDGDPEQRVINQEKGEEIARCMDSLSPRHRQLFVMRFIDGFSYEEIAQKLNIPLGSVKTNIHRARKQMTKLLIEREDI